MYIYTYNTLLLEDKCFNAFCIYICQFYSCNISAWISTCMDKFPCMYMWSAVHECLYIKNKCPVVTGCGHVRITDTVDYSSYSYRPYIRDVHLKIYWKAGVVTSRLLHNIMYFKRNLLTLKNFSHRTFWLHGVGSVSATYKSHCCYYTHWQ